MGVAACESCFAEVEQLIDFAAGADTTVTILFLCEWACHRSPAVPLFLLCLQIGAEIKEADVMKLCDYLESLRLVVDFTSTSPKHEDRRSQLVKLITSRKQAWAIMSGLAHERLGKYKDFRTPVGRPELKQDIMIRCAEDVGIAPPVPPPPSRSSEGSAARLRSRSDARRSTGESQSSGRSQTAEESAPASSSGKAPSHVSLSKSTAASASAAPMPRSDTGRPPAAVSEQPRSATPDADTTSERPPAAKSGPPPKRKKTHADLNSPNAEVDLESSDDSDDDGRQGATSNKECQEDPDELAEKERIKKELEDDVAKMKAEKAALQKELDKLGRARFAMKGQEFLTIRGACQLMREKNWQAVCTRARRSIVVIAATVIRCTLTVICATSDGGRQTYPVAVGLRRIIVVAAISRKLTANSSCGHAQIAMQIVISVRRKTAAVAISSGLAVPLNEK